MKKPNKPENNRKNQAAYLDRIKNDPELCRFEVRIPKTARERLKKKAAAMDPPMSLREYIIHLSY